MRGPECASAECGNDRVPPMLYCPECLSGFVDAGISGRREGREVPAYYQFPSPIGVIQPYLLAEHLPYHAGTALVYVARAGRKPGVPAETDIQKAIDHLHLEITRLKQQKEKP